MSYVSKAMHYKHHITFKGLQETVEKLNTTLEKQPIPGNSLVDGWLGVGGEASDIEIKMISTSNYWQISINILTCMIL